MLFLNWFSKLVTVAFLKGVRDGLNELGIEEDAEANVNPLAAFKTHMLATQPTSAAGSEIAATETNGRIRKPSRQQS